MLRGLVVLVVVAGCGKHGDWDATWQRYCGDVALVESDLDAAFASAEALGKLGSDSMIDDLNGPCVQALAGIQEAQGLTRTASYAGDMMSAGAPASVADRITLSARDEEALIDLRAKQVELMSACREHKADAIAAWVATAHKAHADVTAKLDKQIAACGAK
jgi:hypothetical protein